MSKSALRTWTVAGAMLTGAIVVSLPSQPNGKTCDSLYRRNQQTGWTIGNCGCGPDLPGGFLQVCPDGVAQSDAACNFWCATDSVEGTYGTVCGETAFPISYTGKEVVYHGNGGVDGYGRCFCLFDIPVYADKLILDHPWAEGECPWN